MGGSVKPALYFTRSGSGSGPKPNLCEALNSLYFVPPLHILIILETKLIIFDQFQDTFIFSSTTLSLLQAVLVYQTAHAIHSVSTDSTIVVNLSKISQNSENNKNNQTLL